MDTKICAYVINMCRFWISAYYSIFSLYCLLSSRWLCSWLLYVFDFSCLLYDMFNVCFSQHISIKQNKKDVKNNPYVVPPTPKTIYSWLLHNISAKNVSSPISPYIFPSLKTVLYFVYCCLSTAASYEWLLGWYHSPPIDDGSNVGAVLSNTAYCCVYCHRDDDGITSTTARQLVWAARRGWLLHIALIN